MRRSQKAWVWNSMPANPAGCSAEAAVSAKDTGEQQELLVLNGRRRSLLPRT
ncbi:hypothetical protein [Paenibacillus auburnensis]|uniref:hypothetical protein n=1 Tax=Paenibacillus auburnensis TaxID=2905649 RepID=UPI001F2F3EC0|nr:hypothetical protein [Paenibacillus auburnensis]